MEGAEIEGRTGSLPGLLPDFSDLQLADLVRQGLTWPGDVAVDLILDLVAWKRSVLLHVIDGLGAGPALLMYPSVDHQPGAPQGIVVELTEDGVSVGVEADFTGQGFTVEGPCLVE